MSGAVDALDGIDLTGLEVIGGEGSSVVTIIGGGQILAIQHSIPKRNGAHPWYWVIGNLVSPRPRATESAYVHTASEVQKAIEPLIAAMREARP